MDFKKTDFATAVKIIAGDHGIVIAEDRSMADDEKYKRRESLYTVNAHAANFFTKNLEQDENACAYTGSRWSASVISDFQIGFAPQQWDGLRKWAQTQGIREEMLIDVGLLSESKGKVFDTFRNRIMFPLLNRTGHVIGFTGRLLTENPEAPKYLNTRETEIYSKGRALYGYHHAFSSVRNSSSVYLVEGNPDVLKLHQIGKLNTVGTCGTALTREQVDELKKYATSVTIIGDNDKAGQAAVIRSAKMILEAGMFCKVIPLPADGGKQDPDSFFTDAGQFEEYARENTHDFIIWSARMNKVNASAPDLKTKLIGDLADLIVHLPENAHQVYIEQLGKIIRPKKAWQDQIRSRLPDKSGLIEKEVGIPPEISLSDWEKYGFYAHGNQYYFRTKNGPFRGCNFVMEPLFHIAAVMNAKRLYKITNEFGFSQVIELPQKDLISLANFKLRVESLGNFLFEATETELNKLKRYLYEKTQSCHEIVQLGWQKSGFWAWSNGIFRDTFMPANQYGIVSLDGQNYYLPALSDIYKNEAGLFLSERKFKYLPGRISLHDYLEKLVRVFGENAMISFCFLLSTLFRDHIIRLFGFFPILNLFGPKGTGKSELAVIFLQFFGDLARGPNINNTTKAALADHVALFSNACCHIEEYKNSLEYEKIEFLKGLWDGTGRTRMNMDKDKKKETTNVDCGIILTGQEMPTADIALFSRLIFLSFSKNEFSDQERLNYADLKDAEKNGLGHITHELLTHRPYFLENYQENYRLAGEELTVATNSQIIEDRLFRNWQVVVAAFRTLKDKIRLQFGYSTLINRSAQLMMRQNKETRKSNELSVFWQIVEYLANNGEIRQEVDYKIIFALSIKTDKFPNEVEWMGGKNILLLNHSRIFAAYRIHGGRSKENVLPLNTLEYYLTHSKEYLGRKPSVSFKVEENRKIVEDTSCAENYDGKEMKTTTRRVTTAMVFEYDLLNISIHSSVKKVDANKPESIEPELLPY
jgi:DNA primase catalytic core